MTHNVGFTTSSGRRRETLTEPPRKIPQEPKQNHHKFLSPDIDTKKTAKVGKMLPRDLGADANPRKELIISSGSRKIAYNRRFGCYLLAILFGFSSSSAISFKPGSITALSTAAQVESPSLGTIIVSWSPSFSL